MALTVITQVRPSTNVAFFKSTLPQTPTTSSPAWAVFTHVLTQSLVNVTEDESPDGLTLTRVLTWNSTQDRQASTDALVAQFPDFAADRLAYCDAQGILLEVVTV